METTKLKNGAVEVSGLVVATWMCLEHLIDDNPTAFHHLVMRCRDPEHKLFRKAREDLVNLGLIEADESIDDSIRNIVLSATRGEGLDLVLGNPRAA